MRKLLALLAATAFIAAPAFANNSSNDVLQQIPGQEQTSSNDQIQLAQASDPAGGPVSHAQSQQNAPKGTMTTSHHSHKKCKKNCHCKHKKCHKKHGHKKVKKAKTDNSAAPAAADTSAPADQTAPAAQ